jgi:hypothetical protein
MQRTLKISLLCLALVVATLLPQTVNSADFSAIWDGGNGNWDDPLHWNTNPNYPNNGGGITYDATIHNGNIALNSDITIERFFLNGGALNGLGQLNLNEGLTWMGGSISGSSGSSITLAVGSTSTISSPIPAEFFFARSHTQQRWRCDSDGKHWQ